MARDHGYDSLGDFREAFKQVFGDVPRPGRDRRCVLVAPLSTPLGPMLAGTTDGGVCLLEFAERRMLETQLRRLARQLKASLAPGSNEMLARLDEELTAYFDGRLREFHLPLVTRGTEFQLRVWDCLRRVPYGETRTYGEQAAALGQPRAVRAVGRANGDNRISIIIPCHRVIGGDGKLTGYGGGLWRKRALLEHEQRTLGVASPDLFGSAETLPA